MTPNLPRPLHYCALSPEQRFSKSLRVSDPWRFFLPRRRSVLSLAVAFSCAHFPVVRPLPSMPRRTDEVPLGGLPVA